MTFLFGSSRLNMANALQRLIIEPSPSPNRGFLYFSLSFLSAVTSLHLLIYKYHSIILRTPLYSQPTYNQVSLCRVWPEVCALTRVQVMLGLRDEIQRGSSLAPRAHLEGINLPANFKLPPLHAVYEDAAQREPLYLYDNATTKYCIVPEWRKNGPPQLRTVFVKEGKTTVLNPDGALAEPIAWNTNMPNLFRFAYFTKVDDGKFS